jgi:predicted P-loop ATPase
MPATTKKEGRYMPRSGQTSYDQNSQLHHSSKNSPCPVCERTKDKDCSWTQDGGLVLCHTYANESPPATINGYHFTGNYGDGGYHGPGSAAIYTKKKPRDRTRISKPAQRFKPDQQKQRDIARAAAHVETEVAHLALMVIEGSETLAQAQVSLTAWCKEHGHDKFTSTQLLREKLKEARAQGTQFESDETPRLLREYRLIEQRFGDRLRFNTLKKRIEFDGEAYDPSSAKIDLMVDHDLALKGSREDISDSLIKIAKQRSYNPVGEYLKAVHQQYGDSTGILNDIAERHLGASEPIYQVMIRRFLIAAVARAFEHGCKQDCALILQGGQGHFKSTFFEVLASKEWFTDSITSVAGKDERLKLHRFWILEWSELESIFKRSDISQVKAFVSSQVDDVRAPYARDSLELARPSIIVGTTNEGQFLADTTGNRRFWVVPIKKPMDIPKLRKERDRIWAAAVSLYKAGEQWWLTDDESQEVDIQRGQFESTDPWFDLVQDWVEGLEAVTTNEVAEFALDLDKCKRNSGHEKRIAAILIQLGWERTPNAVSHNGRRKRVYKKGNPKSFAKTGVSVCQ